MRKSIGTVIYVACVVPGSWADEPFPEPVAGAPQVESLLSEVALEEPQEEALRFIFELEPYSPDNFSGLRHNDLYVVAGNSGVANGIMSLLEEDRFQNYWQNAFHVLGIMASVYPRRVDYDRLTDAVRRIEDSDLSPNLVMTAINAGYTAVARFGIERSEAFLAPRMKESFWEHRPHLEQDWASSGDPPWIMTPRDFAIRSFGALGEDGAVERLRALLSEELSEGDEVAVNGVEVVERAAPRRMRNHEGRLELFLVWEDRDNRSDPSPSIEEDRDASGEADPTPQAFASGSDETIWRSGDREEDAAPGIPSAIRRIAWGAVLILSVIGFISFAVFVRRKLGKRNGAE